jgi:hypothetical protein
MKLDARLQERNRRRSFLPAMTGNDALGLGETPGSSENQNALRLGPLVKAPHDFAENNAKHVGRRLVFVVGNKPAPSRASIDARMKRKVRLSLFRKRHDGEITEMDSVTVDVADISVRPFILILLRLFQNWNGGQILSV